MRVPQIARLQGDDGETIAYLRHNGKAPLVLWLGGFKSDMQGTKGEALASWCAASDRACLRFDYFGHGASSGDFRQGTIGRWRENVLTVIDRLTDEDLVLVGSSMGGWLALHAALARPERIKGMLLIAPATDFTEVLFWSRFPETVREAIEKTGEWLWPSAYDAQPYPITRALIEDGRKYLLLGRPVHLSCPVRIIQGMKDPDVPWTHALKLVDALEGDVVLTLVRDGDHRMASPDGLRRMTRAVEELVE